MMCACELFWLIHILPCSGSAIRSMGKRPRNQGSTSRKLSILTRPATEQTPEILAHTRSTRMRAATEQTLEIPVDAEAIMHDPGNASILRCSDSAVESDAATEHIGMAGLSTSDDVTLIAIFAHFAKCYVAMPMVGTCRRIFITWTRKRRQLALELLTFLRWRFHRDLDSGNVAIRTISLALCEIEALIR